MHVIPVCEANGVEAAINIVNDEEQPESTLTPTSFNCRQNLLHLAFILGPHPFHVGILQFNGHTKVNKELTLPFGEGYNIYTLRTQ